jgi:hypothetical protein
MPTSLVAEFEGKTLEFVGRDRQTNFLLRGVLGKFAQHSQGFPQRKPSTFRLPHYVAGARVISNHLFVLLDLPRPEIVELTMDGQEVNRYRGTISPVANRYQGFDGQVTAGTYHFWILAGDEQALTLTQFSPVKG